MLHPTTQDPRTFSNNNHKCQGRVLQQHISQASALWCQCHTHQLKKIIQLHGFDFFRLPARNL
uniref:Uncharacterized protein n=1 Tax=Rhizophora mucronata TaxID=61149 RepID=A0A2P2NGE1_RHIMU